MNRPPTPHLRRAVEVGKCALVAALAFLAISSTVSATANGSAADGAGSGQGATVQELSAAVPGQARLDTLMSRHDCSATGFGADVIPGSALVLRGDAVEHVSFDDGWAVYTGEQPGTLLAVCRPPV